MVAISIMRYTLRNIFSLIVCNVLIGPQEKVVILRAPPKSPLILHGSLIAGSMYEVPFRALEIPKESSKEGLEYN